VEGTRQVTGVKPLNFPLASRPLDVAWLTPAEYPWLFRQIQRAPRRHLHLDWQLLPELLRDEDCRCRASHEGTDIRAVIAATLHRSPYYAQETAWLRLILPSTSTPGDRPLERTWETLRADLHAGGVAHIGLLALEPWVEIPARRWGFTHTNTVITLKRSRGLTPEPPAPPLRIREVGESDLDAVADLDARAFAPTWHHNRLALQTASRQAATFTVLESNHELLGYQLSTWHLSSGHLARLAIRPDRQGQGLGALLVAEMLRFFAARSITTITVNTQADNLSSQRLYRRLGFEPTDHSVAYWSIDLA
jgi:[ribosomal protein S18]-alanine N-acetyltransferase